MVLWDFAKKTENWILGGTLYIKKVINVLLLMSHNDDFYYVPYLDKYHTYIYTS